MFNFIKNFCLSVRFYTPSSSALGPQLAYLTDSYHSQSI